MTKDEFDRECRIFELYIESAKSFALLATGGLAAVATLAGGKPVWSELPGSLLTACASFLVSVIAASAYQSLAVGHLADISGLETEKVRGVGPFLRENAYLSYNAMIVSFIVGVISIAVFILKR